MPSSPASVALKQSADLQSLRYKTGLSGFLATLKRFLGTTPHAAVVLVLIFLWQIRKEGHLTAETGLGYYLGIAGVTALLLLLTYPMRKRLKFMRSLGPTKAWFRLHMFLGLLAPALILAHSSFNLGSTNSTIALFSMLIVSGSGLFGRYFYARIHYGLYGARATVETLHQAIQDQSNRLTSILDGNPPLQRALLDFSCKALTPSKTLLPALSNALYIGFRSHLLRFRAFRLVRQSLHARAQQEGWPARQRRREIAAAKSEIGTYLATIRRVAQLSFYERLFRLWHVMHIPLFYLMILAIIVHVFAVHVY